MQAYLKKVTIAYSDRRQDYENTYLQVKYEQETAWFPLKQRFTRLYGNSIYNKLKVLEGLTLHSFWTLTTKVDGTLMGFHDVLSLVKNGWRDLRSLMGKIGVKNVDYLRVYELTKNYGLHIHVAFYTRLSAREIKLLGEYWSRNIGFVKIYTYTNHRSVFKDNVFKEAWRVYKEDQVIYPEVWADRRESWVTDNKLIMGKATMIRIDQKVNKYIHKYMVKLPSLTMQAVISDNRLRSYACSRTLNKLVKIVRDKFKEDNYIDRGEILDTSIITVHWLEQMERMERVWNKVKQLSKEQTPYFNTIELVLGFDGENKYTIHLEVSFTANAYTVSTVERFGYPRKYASYGRRGFRNSRVNADY